MTLSRRRRRREEVQALPPPGPFLAHATTAAPSSSSSLTTPGGRPQRVDRNREKESIYSLRVLVGATVGFVATVGLLVLLSVWHGSGSLSGSSSSSSSNPTGIAAIKSTRVAPLSSSKATTRTSAMESMDPVATPSTNGAWYASTRELPESVVANLDAVFVLGGGRPSSPDRPPLYVQNRCDDAAAVVNRKRREWKQQPNDRANDDDLPVLCLSAGTAHVPQLVSSATGLPVWESTASASYLLKEHHLSPISVFVETTSYDTIGNAYFARTTHAEWNGWRTLLVITSEFHMARTKAIFDWIFSVPRRRAGHPAAAAKGADKYDLDGYQLYYLSSPDVGLDDEALEARRQRERSSLASVHRLSAVYNQSLSDVWRFLHTNHDLYTASKLVERSGIDNGIGSTGGGPDDSQASVSHHPSSEDRVSPHDAVAKSYGAV